MYGVVSNILVLIFINLRSYWQSYICTLIRNYNNGINDKVTNFIEQGQIAIEVEDGADIKQEIDDDDEFLTDLRLIT